MTLEERKETLLEALQSIPNWWDPMTKQKCNFEKKKDILKNPSGFPGEWYKGWAHDAKNEIELFSYKAEIEDDLIYYYQDNIQGKLKYIGRQDDGSLVFEHPIFGKILFTYGVDE